MSQGILNVELSAVVASMGHGDGLAVVDVGMSIVDQLREDRVAVPYISHRLDKILNVTQNVTVLRDGDKTFRSISEWSVLGIPFPFVIALLVGVASLAFLHYTPFGTRIYAVGGGEHSARLAGLRIDRITLSVYVASGIAAAIGGILLTSRVAPAQPNAASGIELDVITAVVLGGVSLFGGKGRIVGATSGALTSTVLGNGLNLMQIDAFIEPVAKGAALMCAVLLAMRASQTGLSIFATTEPAPSAATPLAHSHGNG